MSKALSNSYLSSMCMELHLVLQSGIPVEEGVAMLLEEESDRKAASQLKLVHDAMAEGRPLFESLSLSPAFPAYLVELVKIGEQTGNLDRVLVDLSRHYERQAETSRSLQNAVLYPAVLLGMMLFVVLILIVKVLPIFEDVYRQLGATMTGAAAAVLRLGTSLSRHWVWIAAVIVILIAAVVVICRTDGGKRALTRFVIPRSLREKIARERFTSAMAMAISSGFDVDDALSMAASLCAGDALSQKIEACRSRVAEGVPFAEAVAGAGILTGLPARMLSVGVRTGASDTVLSDIARRTQQEIVDGTERAISRIEPALVILMSVLVGMILLAVMLPLLGILSTLG